MSILHILNESPFITNQLEKALLFINKQDAMLLTGDAVYALQVSTKPYQQLKQIEGIKLFALEEDVIARSLQISSTDVTLINYPTFVVLCTQYSKVTSWLS